MRIETVRPLPSPRKISMTFSRDQGWAIVAALNEYADEHPHAVGVDQWREWAKTLDAILRRGL